VFQALIRNVLTEGGDADLKVLDPEGAVQEIIVAGRSST
jgi:hypothetical protein